MLNLIKSKIPKLKILFSLVDKRKYNYKVNPFTYKLRKGKLTIKKIYFSQKGVIKLISTVFFMKTKIQIAGIIPVKKIRKS